MHAFTIHKGSFCLSLQEKKNSSGRVGCHKSPKEPKFLGPGRKKILLPTFEMPEEVAPKQRLAQEVPEGRWVGAGGAGCPSSSEDKEA